MPNAADPKTVVKHLDLPHNDDDLYNEIENTVKDTCKEFEWMNEDDTLKLKVRTAKRRHPNAVSVTCMDMPLFNLRETLRERSQLDRDDVPTVDIAVFVEKKPVAKTAKTARGSPKLCFFLNITRPFEKHDDGSYKPEKGSSLNTRVSIDKGTPAQKKISTHSPTHHYRHETCSDKE